MRRFSIFHKCLSVPLPSVDATLWVQRLQDTTRSNISFTAVTSRDVVEVFRSLHNSEHFPDTRSSIMKWYVGFPHSEVQTLVTTLWSAMGPTYK